MDSGFQEVHVMHPFPTDFYGHTISVIVLGYIRPELNFISKGTPSTPPPRAATGADARVLWWL